MSYKVEWIVFIFICVFIHESILFRSSTFKLYLDPFHSVFTFSRIRYKSYLKISRTEGSVDVVPLNKFLVGIREDNFIAGIIFWNFFMRPKYFNIEDTQKKMDYFFCKYINSTQKNIEVVKLFTQDSDEIYITKCK